MQRAEELKRVIFQSPEVKSSNRHCILKLPLTKRISPKARTKQQNHHTENLGTVNFVDMLHKK
jgi:hypothetical protein